MDGPGLRVTSEDVIIDNSTYTKFMFYISQNSLNSVVLYKIKRNSLSDYLIYNTLSGNDDSITNINDTGFSSQIIDNNYIIDVSPINTYLHNFIQTDGTRNVEYIISQDLYIDGEMLLFQVTVLKDTVTSVNNFLSNFSVVINNENDPQEYVYNDSHITNNPPIAYDLSFTIQEDNMGSFELSANDVDNVDLSYILVSDVSYGEVSIVGNVATYEPFEHYHGDDSFTYKVNDGTKDSNIATVNITINAMNDPPTIEVSDVIMSEGETVQNSVTISDVEVDGDYKVTVSQSPNVLESLEYVDNEDGSRVIVTAKAQYAGTATTTVTVTVNDGEHVVNKSFNVTVNAVNDPQTVMLLNGVNRVNEGETLKIRYTVIDEDLLVANGDYTLNVLQGVSEPYALVSTETISGSGGSKYLTGSVEIAIPRTSGDRTETYTIEIRDGVNVASASRTVTVSAVRGCTNASAANYNVNATIDDGSCFILGYDSTRGRLRLLYKR